MKRFLRKYCCQIIKVSDQQDSTKYVWIFPDFATLLDFSWLCHSVDFSWLCHSVETKHNIFCRPNTMWRPRHQNKNTSWMFEILADGRQICGIIAGGHILHMCGCRDYKWLEGAYKELQGAYKVLEGANKELQGAIFNADAARNSAQDYCSSSSKTLKQQNTEH